VLLPAWGEKVFLDLERTPYASASIAQIHRARLANGAPVILQIRRPGIQAQIDADLRILGYIAQLIEDEMPEGSRASSISRSRRRTSTASHATSPARPTF
jgi:predicted unusual protein kinase regulating ubiquinone biosynthesis (AarF/ABC1/UbiB family)